MTERQRSIDSYRSLPASEQKSFFVCYVDRKTHENDTTVCHYVPRECLCTQGHVQGTYINLNRKIICLVPKESNFNAAVVHASVSCSIFPSFTTPTWQGNSRSSDLKAGETGRGEGRERKRWRQGETGQETDSDGQKQHNLPFLKLYTQASEVFPWKVKGCCHISTYSPPWSSQWGHAWPPVWWSDSCLRETLSVSTKEKKTFTYKPQ